MPRFFIDTSDQQEFVRDDVGAEYADLEAARAAATTVLPDMARNELPDGDTRTLLAIVRREDGRIALQASLTFQVTYDPEPFPGVAP